jgi:nucleotide-binding universal stress UspA family protein
MRAVNDIRTILLTTDFSDTSKKAFEPALTLAQRFGAKIVLAYVEEDRLPPLVIEYMAVGVEEILGQQREIASDRLNELAATLPADVGEVETVVALGTPHVEIVRLAEEHEADLIVMATHGRGYISHAILGSTAERVLRRAPCPVLVVRDPDSVD